MMNEKQIETTRTNLEKLIGGKYETLRDLCENVICEFDQTENPIYFGEEMKINWSDNKKIIAYEETDEDEDTRPEPFEIEFSENYDENGNLVSIEVTDIY